MDAAFVDDASLAERFFAIGAGLIFVISDLTLAINMFITPVKYAKFFILGTYYTAQMGFVKWAICKARRLPKQKCE